MLRRSLLAFVPKAGANIVSSREVGPALFVLVVEHIPPKRGCYRARLRIALRDDEVQAVIDRHDLKSVVVFTDRAAEASDERLKEIGSEIKDGFDHGPSYLMSPHLWLWASTRGALEWLEGQRCVKISFGTLLSGIEIYGSMDEVTWTIKEVSGVIDRLAAKIAVGTTFATNTIHVFAPGDKAKPDQDDPKTPPSKWRE